MPADAANAPIPGSDPRRPRRPGQWAIPERHDPLGILAASRTVLDDARHVTVDEAAIDRFVAGQDPETSPPPWDAALHWRGDDDRTVAWLFVLDALNFCFWAPAADPAPRWRVRVDGRLYDGYRALAAALRRAMGEGVPLTDPGWLATVGDDEVAHLLRPDGEASRTTPIPLLAERGANLRELGMGWLAWAAAHPGETAHPARSMVAAAGGSAAGLVRLVTRTFPSFDDVAVVAGQPVPFHKRAQILAADIAGTFGNSGPGAFSDLGGLTAFADYKVPQVLRRLGILRYDATLARRIADYGMIGSGSAMEVEIRAATVWGCELIRQRLMTGGRDITAIEVDWLLWEAGQHLPAGSEPYHRTLTVFY